MSDLLHLGKTALSIELAKKINGEIISCDSMQIYKDMDIGTAKVTEEEKQGIEHYLVDFVSPSERYTVSNFKKDCETAIEEILAKGKTPIVVGGTGLYVNSLIYGIEYQDMAFDEEYRNELMKKAENEEGLKLLYEEANNIDKEAMKIISPNDKKRILRVLEIYHATGKTKTELEVLSRSKGVKYDFKVFAINMDRDKLYDRINRRVDLMIESGLIEETKSVLQMNLSDTAIKAIGYKELIPYINNQSSLDDCIEKLKMETRRYAKRQLTWFRRNKMINWIYIDRYSSLNDIVKVAVDIIDKKEFLNG